VDREVKVIPLDLANCGPLGYAELKDQLPRLDLLINNAGVGDDRKQLEASPE